MYLAIRAAIAEKPLLRRCVSRCEFVRCPPKLLSCLGGIAGSVLRAAEELRVSLALNEQQQRDDSEKHRITSPRALPGCSCRT